MKQVKRIWNLLNTPINLRCRAPIEPVQTVLLFRRHQSRLRGAREEGRALLQKIEEATRTRNSKRLAKCSRDLLSVVQRLEVLEDLARLEAQNTNVFVFSSWSLKQSFQYCTARPEEGMHFITGFERDGYAIGTSIVPFAYAHRSAVGAAGEHRATHQVCVEAHESGHRILALVHSHPGRGINSNHFSHIDEKTQQLWERTTRLVGGIWSRDGYLRWYSDKLQYEVQIVGNHLERIEDNVWKLREA